MKFFDDTWEIIHREMEWGKYPSEEVIRFVARNYYGRKINEVNLLEAGCGGGAITWYLCREGFSVHAFDGSETAIQKTKKRLKEENLDACLEVCDAGSMPYPNEYFDSVIDSAMLYANPVEGIKAILSECHRVLKKNGKIFSSGLFKIGMTGYGTGERLEDHTYRDITEGSLAHRGTVHFFDEDQINRFWTEAGFHNLKIDSIDRTDLGGKVKVSYYIVEAEKL